MDSWLVGLKVDNKESNLVVQLWEFESLFMFDVYRFLVFEFVVDLGLKSIKVNCRVERLQILPVIGLGVKFKHPNMDSIDILDV